MAALAATLSLTIAPAYAQLLGGSVGGALGGAAGGMIGGDINHGANGSFAGNGSVAGNGNLGLTNASNNATNFKRILFSLLLSTSPAQIPAHQGGGLDACWNCGVYFESCMCPRSRHSVAMWIRKVPTTQ